MHVVSPRRQGNVIDDVKPTYTVQAGTWGPPKEAQKENLDGIFGKKAVSEVSSHAPAYTHANTPMQTRPSRQSPGLTSHDMIQPAIEVDPEWEAQKAARAAEEAAQKDEIEAKMAKWLADAAAKKAQGGQ